MKKYAALAEVRAILEETVNPPERLKLGKELEKFRKLLRGLELDMRRDQTPDGGTVSFE